MSDSSFRLQLITRGDTLMAQGNNIMENIDIDGTLRAIEKTIKGIHIRNGKAEGWGWKESHDLINKKWEERYFIIDPPKKKITYYEVPASGKMVKKGEYELSQRSHCKKSSKPNHPYLVEFEGKHNYNMTSTMYIDVGSNEIADEWVKILTKVIKGEQLEILDEAEACCSLCPFFG